MDQLREKIRRKKGIAVIGAGALGTALTHTISHKGYKVSVLTRDEFKVSSINNQDENSYVKGFAGIKFPYGKVTAYNYYRFSDVVKSSGIVILTVPSFAIPKTLDLIKESIAKTQRLTIVLTSKGADAKTGETPYRFTQKTFALYPLVSIVVASVVGFAVNITNKEITKVMVSSRYTSRDANRLIRTLLGSRYIIVRKSYDPNGACLAGLLKNVGAIMIGMCEGMKDYTYPDGEKVLIGPENSRGAFVDEWSDEMVGIAKQLGIKRSTIEGLVGKIDLGLSSSPQGRNWTFGNRLATGESIEKIISDLGTVEGIGAARYLDKVVDSKYIRTLVRVLDKEISPIEAVGIVLNDNGQNTKELSEEDSLLSIINNMGVL